MCVWDCKQKVISMKRVLLAAIALVFTLVGSAQQDAQFSQNMFLNNAINPGATGIKGMHCFNLIAREQWLGFEGRPETGRLNYSGVVQNFGIGAVIPLKITLIALWCSDCGSKVDLIKKTSFKF